MVLQIIGNMYLIWQFPKTMCPITVSQTPVIENFLTEKPNKTLPDPGIEPGTLSSAVPFACLHD